jgi:hypothetical protein
VKSRRQERRVHIIYGKTVKRTVFRLTWEDTGSTEMALQKQRVKGGGTLN